MEDQSKTTQVGKDTPLASPAGVQHGGHDDDILTVDEVALWLRVSPEWVRAHASHYRQPYLPGFKAGKYVRFRRGAVREAVEKWQQIRSKPSKTGDHNRSAA